MEELFAHTPRPGDDQWQLLVDHLLAVAQKARAFAEPCGLGSSARIAGLLHDLGKASSEFQAYLRSAYDGNPVAKGSVDHKLHGAQAAAMILEPLALPILGHHGGLPSLADAKQMLAASAGIPSEVERLQSTLFSDKAMRLLMQEARDEFVKQAGGNRLSAEFAVRIVFSSVVDADALDTEKHWNPNATASRTGCPTLEELARSLARYQDGLMRRAPDTCVNRARKEVYQACLNAAHHENGVFALTVPTGGGKTLSSLRFALEHALANSMSRVIYVAPYTTIIEQTCDVFREALAHPKAVLEHHSSLQDAEGLSESTLDWRLLAAENWDVPVVVTTAVQFFESLFSNKPSRCRKVHNIARSVILLDEAQTLPEGLLEPVLDVLGTLVRAYGCSVVFSTATQPALAQSSLVERFPSIREIVEEPVHLFESLRRVEYSVEMEPVSWECLASDIASNQQCLAVLNTRKDAATVASLLARDERVLYLSTSLCPVHRRRVLEEVRRRLCDGEPCLLISTQVVEAGVDLDFPHVIRAIGPLDRLVQAAGRCNREGKRAVGRVRLVNPAGGSMPRGVYETAVCHAEQMLSQGFDLHDPATFTEYFRRLYRDVQTDARGVQPLRESFDYPAVARAARVIDEDTVPVLVPYDRETVDALCEEVRAIGYVGREVWRRAQLHAVSIERRRLVLWERDGMIVEVLPGSGLYRWLGAYDELLGISVFKANPAELIV